MHDRDHAQGAPGAAHAPLLDRRTLLQAAAFSVGVAALPALPAPAQAAVLPAPAAAAGRRDEDGEALGYEDFLARAVPAARDLLGYRTRFGEDRYLLMLATLAVRLDGVPLPEFRRVSAEGEPGRFLGSNEVPEGCPFVVLHWKLEPGAVVGLHPHTYGSVVTVGLEGEVRVTNYETVDAPDFAATGSFAVRRTQDQVLRAHDLNLVPLSHGFVHGFVAGPEGARGLDITTRVQDRQPNLGLSVGASLDAARALFEARWLPGS